MRYRWLVIVVELDLSGYFFRFSCGSNPCPCPPWSLDGAGPCRSSPCLHYCRPFVQWLMSVGGSSSARLITLSVSSLKRLTQFLAKLGGSHRSGCSEFDTYILSACQYFYMVLNLAHWLYATKGRWSSQLLARWWNCWKLDQPWSSAIAKKFFGFLPITYQIDIRTDRFLEKIRAGKNLGFFWNFF